MTGIASRVPQVDSAQGGRASEIPDERKKNLRRALRTEPCVESSVLQRYRSNVCGLVHLNGDDKCSAFHEVD